MKKAILLVVLGYFSLWFYTFILIVKFIKSLFKHFPEEAKLILGKEKFIGIAIKPFALWDDDILKVAERNKETKALRKKSVRFFYLTIVTLLFLIPVLSIIFIVFFKV